MSIKNVLLEIKRLSKDNGLSEPYIVGGLPRDKVLQRSRMVSDVDITTGDDSVFKLSDLTANQYHVYPVKFSDGHSQITIGNVKFDFSSNFKSPDVEYFLEKAGVKNPTKMQIELFSRDFTCNTLIAPLSLRKISDPTGLALDDIKRKLIRTPLPPRITLRDDTKRVIRVIYLAAKLGFEVEPDIINWTKDHLEKIKEEVSNGFSKNKLTSAAKHDLKKTVRLLSSMGLWNYIYIPEILIPYAARGVYEK
jgi:poly(A) polymerase